MDSVDEDGFNGFTVHMDPDSGRRFLHNEETGETIWKDGGDGEEEEEEGEEGGEEEEGDEEDEEEEEEEEDDEEGDDDGDEEGDEERREEERGEVGGGDTHNGDEEDEDESNDNRGRHSTLGSLSEYDATDSGNGAGVNRFTTSTLGHGREDSASNML